MHVEAMNWSGMGVREYAAALHLSPYALRRWRERLEDGELDIDRRAHLHPAARPTVSDITNGATSEHSLTTHADDTPATRGRRFFTDARKLIVQESEAAGATGSAVARRHGIATGILFRWRAEFGVTQKKQAKLASVTLATDTAAVHWRCRTLCSRLTG